MPENEGLPLQGQMLNDCLNYLDSVRESGVVNMYGAVPWIKAWGRMVGLVLSRHEAEMLLRHWMDTFEERHSDE